MSEATLALLDCNVITLNSRKPRAEAIIVKDGKIVAVGSNKKIRKLAGKNTKIVEGKGRTVVPGLVDCHVHMTGFGFFLMNLNLRNVQSITELQKELREHAEKNLEKTWILGGRWDQESFAERRYPTRWDLDAAVPEKPVLLNRVCGHLAVANSKALELARITAHTSVRGGQIDLDEATGEPNGIIRENALKIVTRAIPKPSQKELERACLLACEKAVESGLTEVHWIVDSADEVRAIQKLHTEGKLLVRVYLGTSVDLLHELVSLGLVTGFGDNMLRIGFVKILADGSLGARTAALTKPYSDKPDTSGMMLYTSKQLHRFISTAHQAGLQLAVHAIGDRAADIVMNGFEKAFKKSPREDHRHRIEHCSVMSPKQIKRMKRLDLIASVQPHFAVSDFWAINRVGKERATWLYPFKAFMTEGLVVASGSDCPVETISPLLGMWAAVTKGSQAFTVKEALKTYTLNAAHASFAEHEKGTIEAGKLADFTVLSEDLFKVSPEEIKNVSVEMTVVNGQIVYRSKNFQTRIAKRRREQ